MPERWRHRSSVFCGAGVSRSAGEQNLQRYAVDSPRSFAGVRLSGCGPRVDSRFVRGKAAVGLCERPIFTDGTDRAAIAISLDSFRSETMDLRAASILA